MNTILLTSLATFSISLESLRERHKGFSTKTFLLFLSDFII